MKLITKLFIFIDIVIAMCFFVVYGPFDDAKVFWITTSMKTMNHKYLASIFYSSEAIEEVMNNNTYIAITEETDVNKITIGEIEDKDVYASIYEKQILEREKDDLYKLIEFKYNEFDCYLIAIYDPTRVSAVTASTTNYKKGKILTEISRENDAILAINGGGYSWTTNYPKGLVVIDGEIKYAQSTLSFASAAINEDGVLIASKLSVDQVEEKNIKYALSFGPVLIVNGVPVTIKGTGGSGMNPRTVIAQRKDGIILFLVVNGYGQNLSWKGRGGVYLNDLLVILNRYGAYNAVNMDGGSSTTMVIGHELINSPCEPLKDGQDFIRSAWILK